MADERSELEELRRLDELERKAGGSITPGGVVSPVRRMGTPATPERKAAVEKTMGPIAEWMFEAPSREDLSALEAAVSGGVGAGASAVAPTVLKQGGRLVRKLPLGPVSKGIGAATEALGTALGKVPLATRAASGGVAGAIGSTAEQTAEMAGLPRAASIPIGAVAGGAPGTLLKGALNLIPGMSGRLARGAAKTIGEAMTEAETAGIPLSEQRQAFLQDKLNRIRGGTATVEDQIAVYTAMRESADQTLTQAKSTSAQLTSQANQLISDAQQAMAQQTSALQAGGVKEAASLRAQYDKRISNLSSQFEAHAQKLRDINAARSKIIQGEADAAANALQEQAASLTPEIKKQAREEARRIIANARSQIVTAEQQVNEEINLLEGTVARARQMARQQTSKASKDIEKIGTSSEATPLGATARTEVQSEFDKLKSIREQNVKGAIKAVFDTASAKEKQGYNYLEGNAFKAAEANIKRERLDPETKLSNNPDQLQKELESVLLELRGTEDAPTRMSFQGLEKLRRIYRDKAFGLPAERASAMEQQQSGRIADYIENIQREMVGDDLMNAYLGQYAKDSEPMRKFGTALGQTLIGKSVKDPELFKRYAADIGPAIFKNAESVDQFVQMVGKEKAENFARQYVARRLQNATPAQMQQFAKSPDVTDWIGNFPNLQQEMARGIVSGQRAASALTSAGRAETAATGEIPTLAQSLVSAKKRTIEEGTQAARKTLQKGRETAASTVQEAEKKAANVKKEAAAKVDQERTELERTLSPQVTEIRNQISRLEQELSSKTGEASDRIKNQIKDLQTLEVVAKERAAGLTAQATEATKSAEKYAKDLLSNTTNESRLREIFFGTNDAEWEALAKVVKENPKVKDAMSRSIGQLIAETPKISQDAFGRISNRLTSRGLATVDQMDKIWTELQKVMQTPLTVNQKSETIKKLIGNILSAGTGISAGQLVPQEE